ncbi:uncharacterized protein LOC107487174 isoform X1 [Arachis duranensis]|uniref:Uncharacterized protein n=2 Tax=Arachis TaxID=3817 RepID=A0A444WVM8_ARAHY|nr:uncharacterized protein LOC107487174 isoform X1 [Arachis duranensis]XP_025651223.1 uncharacterized protein LOC112747433 isoform X1 [Arachis hypogaea]XP_025697876.1 uncharacterized protein LOC112800045 isoform X1 [Arachis hypogaea]QHO44496.1 uncharacterized protein DS421_5g171530 [Arachis hypogaea]RYQ81498.1 hypothetical protein Ahy_Scaffold1g107410 [Arachis hypogaea]
MHRQSLGSPSSKLHHGVALADHHALPADDAPKPHRMSSPPHRPPHKLIHLIPLLTLLCFLILYLCSHTPSPSDLDHVPGFNRSSKQHVLDSVAEINDIERYTDAKRADVFAIRSLRNLQQIQKNRLNRKLADF